MCGTKADVAPTVPGCLCRSAMSMPSSSLWNGIRLKLPKPRGRAGGPQGGSSRHNGVRRTNGSMGSGASSWSGHGGLFLGLEPHWVLWDLIPEDPT